MFKPICAYLLLAHSLRNRDWINGAITLIESSD